MTSGRPNWAFSDATMMSHCGEHFWLALKLSKGTDLHEQRKSCWLTLQKFLACSSTDRSKHLLDRNSAPKSRREFLAWVRAAPVDHYLHCRTIHLLLLAKNTGNKMKLTIIATSNPPPS